MKQALVALLLLCLVGFILAQRAPCGIRYCPTSPPNEPGDRRICALKKSTKEKITYPNSCYMEAANDCNLDYEKISDGPCPSS